MKSIDLFSQAQTQHKAFLINSQGYIESVFIWDSPDMGFISGWLYELHSWLEVDKIKDINNISLQKLNECPLYELELHFICNMYVKWDGDSHLCFYEDENKPVDYLYFGNISYKQWFRNFIFVHEIANMIHRETGGKYGIICDDEDVTDLKELLLKDYKIALIKNETSIDIK